MWNKKSLVELLVHMPRSTKRLIALAVDTLICISTVWLALCLRLEDWVFLQPQHISAALLAVTLFIPIFYWFGLYASVSRYAGWQDMLALLRAFALYAITYCLIFTVIGVDGLPRAIGIQQPLLMLFGIGASRVMARFLLSNITHTRVNQNKVPGVLIFGAGSAGRRLASALQNSPENHLIGFIDDDPTLQGRHLNMVPVYAPSDLMNLVKISDVKEILLAIPSLGRKRRLEILNFLRSFPLHVRTLPSLSDLANGKVTLNDLHEIDFEDLLGRDAVEPDFSLMQRHVRGKVVMVTGAGGSIGKELCRQIVQCEPKLLLLVEISEYSLYQVQEDLQAMLNERRQDRGPLAVELVPLLASVTNESRINEIVSTWCPQTVYHAAAYKHVPLVERNMLEGVRNNVWGTWICARVAAAKGVKNFVLISTDKAVRPTNVMGASKRLAEMVLQAMAHQSGISTCFTMVRFGNVLGSSGSVVPLFRKQIANQGPITLTHASITRYFMTIPEASQLVMQAGAMASGGEVFVLDMGEPVRIYDLACRLVELSGLRVRDSKNPHGDIEINITGLRPGEKLYEELLIGDGAQPTSHSRILKAHESFLDWNQLEPKLNMLESYISASDMEAVRKLLMNVVSGYKPVNEVVDLVYQQCERERGIRELVRQKEPYALFVANVSEE
ncbi:MULTISPECIES: polysaccharide biosynthesis protein [Comamonas]|uniref:polysaccharide biosynthesis protein n=1 Tax=Comamonas TaxID=283 RepID=UPI00050ED191|nr:MULTISPECIES: nucleoside-diphosphate sugar epimerase/dehydratase [Comamonas]KGG84899.1 dTDP-glucose 4,6-dehydratase [Comamonas thiooxydans]KGG95039.1 dTDP-glucose 4,6-dehydratase [Comamonas thiooxydans]KGH00086.1 dTDP-glucose 4,6-dehydratase [Comamonas thiooxydans]KGH06022.1 dTDP-glucose 4,6-dehydratase [Comamonas thiooxydans]TYK71190.1 polysaccharide biosynthesis protein [Comamonas sp. Z1]